MTESRSEPLIIGNCSGFYGDRLEAAAELIRGGPVDVLTGDYLAELTMAILFRKQLKDPSEGYVGTFLRQMEEIMGECLERGIRVVANAGGLNPQGMADALARHAEASGLSPRIAWIDGDDLMPRLDELRSAGEPLAHFDTGTALADTDLQPVTASAYLGCWGVKEALDRGADIVVCPRVTDAAVVMGPAAWHFGWRRDDLDPLAGALTAGHIIECGAQATGGNYSFFEEVPSFRDIGYPLAEMRADGSFVVTKHPGTGGLVSVGTVTAQLMYEVSTPEYVNPDVVAHFDTMALDQEAPDRVAVTGVKGSPPPSSHKVSMNTSGGHRNGMTVILTGLDIEAKARVVEDALFHALGGKERFDHVDVQLIRADKTDPPSNEEAFAYLRINVTSSDAKLAGRLFSAKLVEQALANVPGFNMTAPPDAGTPLLVYWPTTVESRHIREYVHVDGETIEVEPSQILELPEVSVTKPGTELPAVPAGETVRVPLGRIFATRAGDKGGNANLGVWAGDAEAYAFLREALTVERLRGLLPDIAPYEIERYELPNLYAVNFYIRGILGWGAASNFRMDPQAKTLGEYLRARVIEAPKSIIPEKYLSESF